MPRALKVCSCTRCDAHPGSCPELVQAGRCTACSRAAEQRRGTATQRGYTSAGHQRFRRAVLSRDPICVLCHMRPSQHADHHPLSRRDLEAQGLNPNDPQRGRGLCQPCHSKATAANPDQRGGWYAR